MSGKGGVIEGEEEAIVRIRWELGSLFDVKLSYTSLVLSIS